MKMEAIQDIYDAINPMPAMLSAKGKSRPEVNFRISANAEPDITLSWVKSGKDYDWDREYKSFVSKPADELISAALAFINALPSAEAARLHDFMGHLGKLIDTGRDLGIEVDYLNPLTDTMKRLSENILTHQPAVEVA